MKPAPSGSSVQRRCTYRPSAVILSLLVGMPAGAIGLPACTREPASSNATSTDPGASGRTVRPRTGAARVGEERVGIYRGTLQRGDQTTANHEVEVLADTDGSPNVTVFDFCSLQMRGDGPTFTAEEGSRCLVDLGDGRRSRPATGEATFDNGTLRASVRFPEEDVVWTFEGAR